MMPGRTLPVPMAPIMLSPPPELMVMFSVSPHLEQSSGRSLPAGSAEERRAGSLESRSGATASRTGLDQVRVFTSSKAVPEASPYSIDLVPESHQLM